MSADFIRIFSLSAVSVAALGTSLFWILYPLALYLLSRFPGKMTSRKWKELPSIDIVTIVRNAPELIVAKIHNTKALHYPSDRLNMIIFSDGSTDATFARAEQHLAPNIHLFCSSEHIGKNESLNKALEKCTSDIVVFSDADAMLATDALQLLIQPLANVSIAGVCGQRIIGEEWSELRGAQNTYIGFDSRIKEMESKIGSISSNDGKIFAIKRPLFKPVHQAVTDDLFTCLSIISQHYSFVFEPRAKAYIKTPSRRPFHEIQRRRRIVARSLKGISLHLNLLNPFKYGFFSIGLLTNKICRRLQPLFMILFLTGSFLLAGSHFLWGALLGVQLAGYALAFVYLLQGAAGRRGQGRLQRISSLAFYFCIGNIGTLLGCVDFLFGRETVKWEPVKKDCPTSPLK